MNLQYDKDILCFDHIIRHLEKSSCYHLIERIFAFTEIKELNELSKSDNYHSKLVGNFIRKSLSQNSVIWLDRYNQIQTTADTNLYGNHILGAISSCFKNKSVNGIVLRKLAKDCLVDWLNTPEQYLTTEHSAELNCDIVQLNNVSWLHLIAVLDIPLIQIRQKLPDSADFVKVQCGWKMQAHHGIGFIPSERPKSTLPLIQVKCTIGDTIKEVQSYLKKEINSEGWNYTENDDDYAFAEVLEMPISKNDLHDNLKIHVRYNDTVNRWWKGGLRWAFAECRIFV